MRYKIMNSREVKQLCKILENQWGPLKDAEGSAFNLDYVFLKNDKDKVFIVNREVEKVDFSKLKINSLGLYLGEMKFGFRVSIEGSQLIGPSATRNVVSLSDSQIREWLAGEEVSFDASGFVIVKHGKDYFGCGKAKEGRILNYVPKARRVKII